MQRDVGGVGDGVDGDGEAVGGAGLGDALGEVDVLRVALCAWSVRVLGMRCTPLETSLPRRF